jgi:hypothetical protein
MAADAQRSRRREEEKRRREEAELRSLIQHEAEQARVLQGKIMYNESELMRLQRQLDKQNDANELDLSRIREENAQKEGQLSQRAAEIEEKRRELELLNEEIDRLQRQKSIHRAVLASFFVRHDMRPDPSIMPKDVGITNSQRPAMTTRRSSLSPQKLQKKMKNSGPQLGKLILESIKAAEDAARVVQTASVRAEIEALQRELLDCEGPNQVSLFSP